jgi:small GTP-binding protein
MTTIKSYKGNILLHLVILIGDCRVGKTSFLNYITGKSTDKNNLPPTIGVEYAPIKMKIQGEDINVNIWDTCIRLFNIAGAEQYKAITSSYYRKCQGIIIIFDITDRKTFSNLKSWTD